MSEEEDVKTGRLLDRRIVERNIKKGLLARKDYDKFLKALPDVRDKILPIEERGAVDDDGDEG